MGSETILYPFGESYRLRKWPASSLAFDNTLKSISLPSHISLTIIISGEEKLVFCP